MDFRTKVKADATLDLYKARLVAKGFQHTPGVKFFDTFTSIVKSSTIRIILTIAVTRQWEKHHIDVNNTFLNEDLQEIVFMAQPKGFVDPSKPTHVCRLRKALYGLKQTPTLGLGLTNSNSLSIVGDFRALFRTPCFSSIRLAH